jgi:predicted NUDIX family NTP pyrophosphohydrolase
VHVWAIEEDWDPINLQSNTFAMEWPPGSGQTALRSTARLGLALRRRGLKF